MAYEKQNWECGQVITADKLNHMEDGIANAGGDCDAGYVCYEDGDLLFTENVTPTEIGPGRYMATLQFDKVVRSDISVSINGGEPVLLTGKYDSGIVSYGDPMLQDSQCCFLYISEPTDSGWRFVTTLSDVHTVEVRVDGSDPIVAQTPCFVNAVKSLLPCHGRVVFRQTESVTVAANGFGDIYVYPDPNDPRVYGAAIMGFYFDSGLSCYDITPYFNTGEGLSYLEYFIMGVKNNTANPITINNARLTVYGETECGQRAV